MRPQRRPGLSLTEVLVAMFVMALGLMALLTLFPLGAMQVGQALKDDRTAQTVSQADAWVRVWWRDQVVSYNGNPNGLPGDPALNALDDPNLIGRSFTNTSGVFINSYFPSTATSPAGNLATPPNLALRARPASSADLDQRINIGLFDLSADVLADPTGKTPALQADSSIALHRYASRPPATAVASYPLLIDPLGYLARSSSLQFEQSWAGRNSTGNTPGVYGVAQANTPLLLPRRNTVATPSRDPAFATCALTDDLTYQPNGGAGQNVTDPNTGASVPQQLNRQGRYTWAALIQRPDNSRPDQASLTVLVFDGRPPFLGVAGDEAVLTNDGGTSNFHSGVVAGSRSVSLNVPTRGADQPPLARRGGWITVVSMDRPGVANAVRGVSFHRITGLTTLDETTVPQYSGGPNVAVTPVALDIDPPIPSQVSANPQVVLFAGLSEVFERVPLSGN